MIIAPLPEDTMEAIKLYKTLEEQGIEYDYTGNGFIVSLSDYLLVCRKVLSNICGSVRIHWIVFPNSPIHEGSILIEQAGASTDFNLKYIEAQVKIRIEDNRIYLLKRTLHTGKVFEIQFGLRYENICTTPEGLENRITNLSKSDFMGNWP